MNLLSALGHEVGGAIARATGPSQPAATPTQYPRKRPQRPIFAPSPIAYFAMIAAPAPAGTSSAPTLAPPPAQYAGLPVPSFFVSSIVGHRASGTCATVDAVGLPPQQPAYAPQAHPPPQGYAPQGYAPQGYAPQAYPPQGYAPQGYAPQAYPPQAYAPQTNWCATFLAGLSARSCMRTCDRTAGPRSPCRRRSHSPKGIRR
jgi:hypothetical protein